MGPVELLGKNDLEAAPRMNLCSVTAQKVRSRSALKKKKLSVTNGDAVILVAPRR